MKLQVTFADGNSKEMEFGASRIRIGSDPKAEVCVENLPPTYAWIRERNGAFLVQPEENSEVYVNDKRVILPKPVGPSDIIRVSDLSLRVIMPAIESEGAAGAGPTEGRTPVLPTNTQFLQVEGAQVPRLLFNTGTKREEYEIRGPVIAGRDPTADLVIDDPYISRYHLKFSFNEEGSVVMEDIGGRNPILVNSRVVRKKRLYDGDEIRVGQTRLLYRYEPDNALSKTAVPAPDYTPPPAEARSFPYIAVAAILFAAVLLSSLLVLFIVKATSAAPLPPAGHSEVRVAG